jgi:3-phosphoshikimate 1-carboxyvinyltransferase
MVITLSHSTQKIKKKIQLTSSKSESNRALIIQALCSDNFKIENLAKAEDTIILNHLLNNSANTKILDVGAAGTAMRFLTAFLAIQNEECDLTGDPRMKERPIKILVEALQQLGADITYLEKEGFPPLKIKGVELVGSKLQIDGGVSSQYISALLMIAPNLKNGLKLEFTGELSSKPFVDMTISMMQHFGANVEWRNGSIIVNHGGYIAKDFCVEADWSAASYWYSIAALSKSADITLYGLKKESLQGDTEVQNIYENFGVTTEFLPAGRQGVNGGIRLTKNPSPITHHSSLSLDFTNFPDIAQTVAVTCAALKISARLTGLKTLRIKETDRIAALQIELNNLGFNVEVDGDDVIIGRHSCESRNLLKATVNTISTYNDHRMAMAFAPLALLSPIKIDEKEVVKKSYPNFWKDLESAGFKIS